MSDTSTWQSVILVGSVSDLARQGVSGDTEELTRTIRILREKQERQGVKVQVSALPPVLLAPWWSQQLQPVEKYRGDRGMGGQAGGWGWSPSAQNQGRGSQLDVGEWAGQKEECGGAAAHRP